MGASPNDGKGSRVLRRYLKLAGGYWRGPGRWKAWGLTAFVLVLVAIQLGLQVSFNAWNRYFFDFLEARDTSGLWTAVSYLPFLVVANAAFISLLFMQRMRLQLRWREWLTRRLTSWWISEQRYYRLGLIAPEHSAPEYRIAEDVRLAVDPLVEFALGILSAVATAATFAAILWNVAGSLTVTLFERTFEIPAYMAIAAVIYAIVASTAAYLAGRPLVGKVAEKNETEAQFRATMTRLRENAESVALIRGDRDERSTVQQTFAGVVGSWFAIIRQQGIIGLVLNTNSAIFAIVPLLLVTPKYLSGHLTLGAVIQIVAAFSAVQGALVWFVDNFVRLAEWFASARRVIELTDALDEIDAGLNTAAGSNEIEFGLSEDDAIHFESLSVADRAGQLMISESSVVIEPGEKILVTGESGTGKSTLIRALAGLWPWGGGRILVPQNRKIAFVPQRPYMPAGSLRDCLLYPYGATDTSDKIVQSAMERCGIGYLVNRLHDEDHWERILSGGEKQRVAFARLLIQHPDIIVMDEATSALDEDSQKSMLQLLEDELRECTVISVGHRPGIEEFHTRKIHLDRLATGAMVTEQALGGWRNSARRFWRHLRSSP